MMCLTKVIKCKTDQVSILISDELSIFLCYPQDTKCG